MGRNGAKTLHNSAQTQGEKHYGCGREQMRKHLVSLALAHYRAVYLKVVHRRSDAQLELDARVSTPILTTGLAVSDALLKPGLLELSSSTRDTVTHHNSWMTTFGPVALLKLVI